VVFLFSIREKDGITSTIMPEQDTNGVVPAMPVEPTEESAMPMTEGETVAPEAPETPAV